jgi:prepilin-type processing-associated H-X9-DG protein
VELPSGDPTKDKDAVPKQVDLINQPAREWAIADAFTYETDLSPVPNRRDGQWRRGTYQLSKWAADPRVNLPKKPYHSGGLNQLCFDGHVEYQRVWRGTINGK